MSRACTRYIRQGRNGGLKDLKEVENISGWMPDELWEVYSKYKGIELPQNKPKNLLYFFGHFYWEFSEGLIAMAKASCQREKFPLSQEILVARGHKLNNLLYCRAPDGEPFLAVARPANSDVRYPAFDSFSSMIGTYLEALEVGAWKFDEHDWPIFDNQAFLEVAKRNNRYYDYWYGVVNGLTNFEKELYETGILRPRVHKAPGEIRRLL